MANAVTIIKMQILISQWWWWLMLRQVCCSIENILPLLSQEQTIIKKTCAYYVTSHHRLVAFASDLITSRILFSSQCIAWCTAFECIQIDLLLYFCHCSHCTRNTIPSVTTTYSSTCTILSILLHRHYIYMQAHRSSLLQIQPTTIQLSFPPVRLLCSLFSVIL